MAYWVSNEVYEGSVELSCSRQSHSPFYHQISSRDNDGKDGSGMMGVGEIAEPEWEGDQVPVELRDELQQHVVLAL